MAIKDVILTKGVKTTCAAKMLAEFIAPYDATSVQRLDSAGAVFLGKANCQKPPFASTIESPPSQE